MATEIHKRPRVLDPPKCKSCGKNHWGTCMNHDARGAIGSQAPKAAGVPANRRLLGRPVGNPSARPVATNSPTISVDSLTGDDANPGTEAAPVKSMQRAVVVAGEATKPKRLKAARKALADGEKKPVGRPKNKEPFDKKAHDRRKSAERRAAKKAAAAMGETK